MDTLYVIELEPEVRSWLELLPDNHHRKVEEYAELLAASGTQTPMPFARPLEEGVYELRPTLGGMDTRITYWFAPGRRIVLLTVFRKTRMREAAQVARGGRPQGVRHRAWAGSHHVQSRRKRRHAMSHTRWKLAREKRLAEEYTESPEVAAERAEIRLAMAFAKAVYDRRVELGLTQTQLAERAGLTQAKISRVEGADTVPTLPLLRRLTLALNASLNIALDDDHEEVTFTAHPAA
ncbi:type II toxin-antitoxin system RelE/ParE family toxin [Streptomyces hokutonensis]|uniref:type II toxin-antitoxin system RelE/ParE family toxin n=1 Tax=Streptomyces hokutonensis TaxID=1306990 RepID=UPI003F54039B